MKIAFRKITPNRTPFSFETERYRCEGIFRRLSHTVVEVELHLVAESTLVCDRCASSYRHPVDERMTLRVSDGCFEGDDLDVIEMFDQQINFDAIVTSELETIRSDYHLCTQCNETEGE